MQIDERTLPTDWAQAPLPPQPARHPAQTSRSTSRPSPRASLRLPGRQGRPSRSQMLPLAAIETHAFPVGTSSPLAERVATRTTGEHLDYWLLGALSGLLVLGLLMVYSSSQFAVPGDPSYWFRRQVLWAVLGLIALSVCSQVDYHLWRLGAAIGMLVSVGLLVLVLRNGHAAYGAQRWLNVGISIQPSELAKLALAVYLADWLVRKGDEVRTTWYGLLPFAALMALVLGLVLMQNDLGTTLVLAGMSIAVFFISGAQLRQVLAMLAVGGSGALLLSLVSAFRRARLLAFLHPLPPHCSQSISYQLCQGLVSLGSGGITGHGLGASVQKAGYLPNPFTDSIFAVTGDELGLIGCAAIVLLFGVLAYRGILIGQHAPDAFGALLACGITSWLVLQAIVNIGSVTDAIPFTGVPLPFVSFGGSSLITSLAAVGILLNISRAGARAARAGQAAPPPRMVYVPDASEVGVN